LQELVPRAARFVMLVNPNNPLAEAFVTDVRAAAAAIGRQIEVLIASTSRDIDTAFAMLVEKRADALLVGLDPLFVSSRVQLATLAARHAVPAIYPFRDDAEAGGLMSYGPSNTDLVRQAGIYIGRILKGEKPADMPILRATKFELVINLKTAKALGLTVPDKLLVAADEVIE
jgi:putative ABC transport system substrate-binding protein